MVARLRNSWHLLVPAFTTLVIGLWGLGTPAPWGDEQVTIDAVQYPLHHLWEAPLLPYYGVMWVWSIGGHLDDIAWLRLFSVLCMVGASVFAAATAKLLANAIAGVAAGLIFALAPLVERYSQEARVYALATMLVAAATWSLILALTDKRRRWWIGYAIALVAAAGMFPISLAVVPAHAIILTGFPEWQANLRRWFLWCLWLLPVAAAQVWMSTRFGFMHSNFAKPDLQAILGSPAIILGSTFGVAVVVLGLTTRIGLRWVLGTALGVASVAIVSWLSTSWWLERSFKPLTTLLCIAAGLALAKVGRAQVVAVLVVLAIVAFPELQAARQPEARGSDAREIAVIMDANGTKGDFVLQDQEALPWWTVEHILKDWERFTVTKTPVPGRYWELLVEPTCQDFREWKIIGEVPLRLCL